MRIKSSKQSSFCHNLGSIMLTFGQHLLTVSQHSLTKIWFIIFSRFIHFSFRFGTLNVRNHSATNWILWIIFWQYLKIDFLTMRQKSLFLTKNFFLIKSKIFNFDPWTSRSVSKDPDDLEDDPRYPQSLHMVTRYD